MITVEDIRRKAERLYPRVLCAWLDGDDTFFPKAIPGRKTIDPGALPEAIRNIQRLREGSKEARGFGYSIEWRTVNSTRFGRNSIPHRILFDTRDDLLRFIGKHREFESFAVAADRLRSAFPALDGWVRANVNVLISVSSQLDDLTHVLQYFHEHPRPGRFARELPLRVDTKFIKRHERILRDWFDLTLPPHTIRSDELHFERRYGLRYAALHICTRFLDAELQHELRFPCAELSLPARILDSLGVESVDAFIVENKVNLLTMPRMPRAIAFGGLGKAVTELRYVQWLRRSAVTYWGDLDVEGFQILSSLRGLLPDVRSVFMDVETLTRWRVFAVSGNASTPDTPPYLTDPERAAFLKCRESNLRLEQERLPHHAVVSVLTGLEASCAARRTRHG